MFSNKNIAAGL